MEVVQAVLGGAEVNLHWTGPDKGDTVLHRACRFGRPQIVKELLKRQDIDVNQGNLGNGSPLFIACQEGHDSVVELLLADPRVIPDQTDEDLVTPFFMASQEGHKGIVTRMMADQRIDVNHLSNRLASPFLIACECGHASLVSAMMSDSRVDVALSQMEEASPFHLACQRGHLEVVQLLLEDPRVDINKPRRDDSTPIWFASQNGHLSVVQHILASGRGVDTLKKTTFNNTTPAEQARRMVLFARNQEGPDADHARTITQGSLIAALLDSYEKNLVEVTSQLRRSPGIRGNPYASPLFPPLRDSLYITGYCFLSFSFSFSFDFFIEHFIGQAFALVVFFADGYLRSHTMAPAPTLRFFHLSSRLPLELQMVLCNVMFGSAKEVVSSKTSEPGFKWLSREATWD